MRPRGSALPSTEISSEAEHRAHLESPLDRLSPAETQAHADVFKVIIWLLE